MFLFETNCNWRLRLFQRAGTRIGRRPIVRVPYWHLDSIASEVKNAKNEEYIVLATP